MLFTKENVEKIKGLIEELNDSYDNDIDTINFLSFNPEIMKVCEIRKVYVGSYSTKDITNEANWKIVSCKDVTQVFKQMLMYIGE